jgi:hypothetical protein
MAKYRLIRDNSANGTAINTVPAPAGMIAPKLVYLTKKFKKGDIVDGTVATQTTAFAESGKSLLVKTSSGVTTTNGIPYSGEVELALSLTNGALETLDGNDSDIKNSKSTIFVWNPTRKLIAVALTIGSIYGLLKFTKVIK